MDHLLLDAGLAAAEWTCTHSMGLAQVGLFLSVSLFLGLCVDEEALCACLGVPAHWINAKIRSRPSVRPKPHIVWLMWIGSFVSLLSLVTVYTQGPDMASRFMRSDMEEPPSHLSRAALFSAFVSVTFCTVIFAMHTSNLKWTVAAYLVAISVATSWLDLSLLPLVAVTDTALVSSPTGLAAAGKMLASISCSCCSSSSVASGRSSTKHQRQHRCAQMLGADSVNDSVYRAGAASYSSARAATFVLSFFMAMALEAVSPPGSQTHRMLQPIWNMLLLTLHPYVTNMLFPVTVATVTFVVLCCYFSFLDLTHQSRTKIQRDWWPTPGHMWAAAWPQLLVYAVGQLLVWALWIHFPEKYTVTLPQLAPSSAEIGFDLAFCVVVGDFLIYWEHRIMHWVPYLRRNIHSVHHEYTAVFSWAGGWVHPVEDLLVVACQLVPVLIVQPHPLTQWAFACFWVICLIDEHSGHDVWWSPYQVLPFTGYPQGGGAAPHDIHHYRPTKNLGFIFIVWDRLFGTFEEVGEPNNPYVAPFCKTRRPSNQAAAMCGAQTTCRSATQLLPPGGQNVVH